MTGVPHVLLDCTRLVHRAWSGDAPTGIDRVCDAYGAHYAPSALAVLQLRGRARVLNRSQSRRLFDLLAEPARFRARFASLAAQAALRGAARSDIAGKLYLNVSHTDFDLDSHRAWIARSGVRPVYMVHDLIPIEHPEVTTPHKVARHHGRVLQALRVGNGIIANSRTTADALRAFATRERVEAPPILAAPLGAPDLPQPPSCTDQHAARFVCVSTIEPRKNHALLLDIWQRLIARLGEAAPRLELIGRWGVASDPVRRRLREDRHLARFVSVHSACADSEIARRVAGARALLAPSRAEGFGLTVVEALKLGVPVIASDLPAFREGGGDIPTYLAPDAADDWHRSVIAFLGNGAERQRQLAALPGYRAPTWDAHFARVDDWLRNLPPPLRLVSAPKTARPHGPAGREPAMTLGMEHAG